MKTKCLIVMSFLFGFFVLVTPVFAVSISIDNAPTSINDQPFTVDVSVTGASPGQNYLRVDLYKDGTSNYFGETSNGPNWYSGSDGTQYVPITIVDSKTIVTATLQARLGTPTQTEYPGAGNYKLRIRRYTSSGSSAATDETPLDIQITYTLPTPTFTPVPTPTPTNIPTNTPTPSRVPTPTKNLIPTATPTKVPTPFKTKPSISPQLTTINNQLTSSKRDEVLGVSDSPSTPTPTSGILVKSTTDSSGNVITFIFCGVGTLLLVICGILVYLKKKRGGFITL